MAGLEIRWGGGYSYLGCGLIGLNGRKFKCSELKVSQETTKIL